MNQNQIDELTRQGKNLCPSCGRPKEMYYRPWCPHCEKPEPKPVMVLNLIQALKYLEANGHTGIEGRVCNTLIDLGVMNNDTYTTLFFAGDEDTEDEHAKDLAVLFREFGFVDKMVVEISW